MAEVLVVISTRSDSDFEGLPPERDPIFNTTVRVPRLVLSRNPVQSAHPYMYPTDPSPPNQG